MESRGYHDYSPIFRDIVSRECPIKPTRFYKLLFLVGLNGAEERTWTSAHLKNQNQKPLEMKYLADLTINFRQPISSQLCPKQSKNLSKTKSIVLCIYV